MITVHGSAAALYALALAIDAADPDADVTSLIVQGKAWVKWIDTVPDEVTLAHYRTAAAMFMRAWARHAEPDVAAELIGGAEDLELARDMHIATHVPEVADA